MSATGSEGASGQEQVVKSFRKELYFNIPQRRGFVNITPQVSVCVEESGVREGLVLVNSMHITASVFINDDEPGLHRDFDAWLERLADRKSTRLNSSHT